MASRFETLADLLPEPMALVSPAGTIQAANRAFAALAGRDTHALAGDSLDAIGWSSAGGWPEYLKRCARTRSLVLGAAVHHRAGSPSTSYRCEGALYQAATAGAEALVLLRLQPKEASSSRFIALTQKIAELGVEIARRHHAEQRAREQSELLQVTLASIGDAVIVTDTAGRVTFVNGIAERLTGWRRSEATAVHVREIFRIINEDTREPVEDPVAKVLTFGSIVGLANHTILIARDGIERPIDDSGAPIVDESGRLHGVVLVFRDVTDLRAAQRQEVAARKAAEAANRAKDEFLATLSHELRTPLNAILGWTRMLLWGVIEEPRRVHALEVIERNAQMQARLIEDLLDLSRIMVGQLRLQIGPVDLEQIIEAALDSVRPAAENKFLNVTASVRVRSAVHGDAARLQQVVWNLLANAVKFTPPHGTISVEASESDGVVRIVVRDSGEGIAESLRPRLFTAFAQGDASFARPHGGLGLGLTIVRRLVEAHGGRVEAESAGPGRGAAFTVTLPVGEREMTAPSPDGATIRDLRGCRVLVVEDNADSAELTRLLLETAGAEVVTSGDAREALTAVSDGGFDVLVADIGLPGEDGLWLIQQVRRLFPFEQRTLPAVALTAFAAASDRQSALAAGYDEYLPKPLDLDALLGAIGRLRAQRRDASDDPHG